MLVQPTEDEGEGSERPSEPQPTPSPPHPSEAHVTPQRQKSKILKQQVQEVEKATMPFILHHKAWLRTVKRKNQHKKKVLKTSKRRSVFKQGRKTVKSSKDEGKTDKVDEKGESAAQQQSAEKQDEGTDIASNSASELKTKSELMKKGFVEKLRRFDDNFITRYLQRRCSDSRNTKKRKGGHMKMLARKRKRPQPNVDSDDKHRKCLNIVTFEGTIYSEIMERKSFISKLDKISSPEVDYLVIYRVNGNFRAFNYLMEVLHIFDRQDLFHLYDLVIKQYSESTPEGIELILWGDLKIMMKSSIEVIDQEFKDRTVIHMLVERKYPLSKELLQRMLDFGLEVKEESTASLDLIRVLNSPCFMVKSWLVQDQTVLGKDYSNLLIADSLLKTIWFINAPCYGNEALASPKANGIW
ncbi:hypothetical protein Tco_0827597 [Tanacetum coccineum]